MRPVDLAVYVITDRRLARGRSHEEIAAAAVAGGATVVQLRDKELTTRQMVETAVRMLALVRPAGVPLVINDRVDVVLAADADGVHVGPDDLTVEAARRILGPDRIVGASAGTVEEAVQAEREGADYLGVGSVFETASKADAGPPIGIEGLSRIVQAVRLPVVAIGGITLANAAEAIRAGATGVAVISAVVAAADIAAATRSLVEVVRAARG
ncbi:MAG: thiamine phosphate synthase [Armatimonadota bacterium]|nr:thiamine phosphate synthase [Armatimonadota bacterium]MDR7465373.1 thiamine phosphate synthase [Armatimonadota bacterium]MDR7468717.1 thiamine phosphate synthase [Armatimonadota bacterium]MDR7474838.1 thiamine phosphate synthase [Armatimonadota bacterium]MDR7538545.1 thiamine phosphate synthase [Armatimonadota bacterium]